MKTEMNRIGLTYADLNATQKKWIDAVVECDPSLKTANSISRKNIEKLHAQLMEKRETGGVKIGWPNWLVRGEKIDRANYPFPGPEATPLTAFNPLVSKKSTSKPRSKKTEQLLAAVTAMANMPNISVADEFMKDLEEYGL